MAIIQKISSYIKKKYNFFTIIELKSLRLKKFNPIIIFSFLIIFTSLFFITSNLVDIKNEKNSKNLEEITKSKDFSSLTNFLISKVNSPYEEINYVIKNNDNRKIKNLKLMKKI